MGIRLINIGFGNIHGGGDELAELIVKESFKLETVS